MNKKANYLGNIIFIDRNEAKKILAKKLPKKYPKQIILTYFYLNSLFKDRRRYVVLDALELAKKIYQTKRIQHPHRKTIWQTLRFLERKIGGGFEIDVPSLNSFATMEGNRIIILTSRTKKSYRKMSWELVDSVSGGKLEATKLQILLNWAATSHITYRKKIPKDFVKALFQPNRKKRIQKCLDEMVKNSQKNSLDRVIRNGDGSYLILSSIYSKSKPKLRVKKPQKSPPEPPYYSPFPKD